MRPAKLPNYALGTIIFFSATQLGYHFWPESALVYGLRVNYLSPTLYFLDILIILYLFILFAKLGFKYYLEFSASNLGFLLIFLTNLLFSANPLATLSWSLHLLLYTIFLFTIPPATIRYSLFTILPITILFQVVAAAIQVTIGRSVGDPLSYLGESVVSMGSPGIATGSVMGEVVLRAYGTFGHPNVLAGWLVVSLLIVIKLSQTKRDPTFNPDKGRIFVITTTTLTIIGALLTQSLSAGLALFGIIIPFYLIKNLKMRMTYLIVVSLFTIHYSPFTPSRSNLSITERLDLQQISLKVIEQKPFFGTGAQASITTYPSVDPGHRLLQPDHNSFTLFLSWFGLAGVFAIIYALKNYLGFRIWNLRFILPLLPLLLLDHYFLTSPQGLFILVLYLIFCNFDKLKTR